MHISDIEKEINSLWQDGTVHVEFGDFSVTLGDNGLYYLSLNEEIVCLKGCINENECDCSRAFPNSFSFKKPLSVVEFIELNLFNYQEEFK